VLKHGGLGLVLGLEDQVYVLGLELELMTMVLVFVFDTEPS